MKFNKIVALNIIGFMLLSNPIFAGSKEKYSYNINGQTVKLVMKKKWGKTTYYRNNQKISKEEFFELKDSMSSNFNHQDQLNQNFKSVNKKAKRKMKKKGVRSFMTNPVKAFKNAAKEMDEDFDRKFEEDWEKTKREHDRRFEEMKNDMYRPRVNNNGTITMPVKSGGFF